MHFTIERLLTLFCVLGGLGAVLWLILALLIGWAMLTPPRMSSGKAIYHLRRLSPGDLGLNFEEIPFVVTDSANGKKLSIAGWWIPAASVSEKCAVILHGYADAKVGAIAWAPLLHDLNLNILAIDLRAHGESGGRYSTGGFHERDDVTQVLSQLASQFPDQTRHLILFGASLGAAVACAVATDRPDLSGLILDSPFADYERAIAIHTRLTGLPGGALLCLSIKIAEWISRSDFSAVRPVDMLAKTTCPAMLILCAEDALLETEDRQALEQAAAVNPRSSIWIVPETGHIQAIAADPIEYEAKIRTFLESIENR